MAGHVSFEAWYDHPAEVVRGRWRLPRVVTYAASAMVAVRSVEASEAPLVISPAPGEAAVPEHRWLDGRLWVPDTGARSTGVAGAHRDAAWLLARLAGGPAGRTTLAGDAGVRRVDTNGSGRARAELLGRLDGHAVIDGMAWEATQEPGLEARWRDGVRVLSFERIPSPDVETYCVADLDLAVELSGPFARVPGMVVHRPDLVSGPFLREALGRAAYKVLTWGFGQGPQVARLAAAMRDGGDFAGLAAALSDALSQPWAARADAEAHRLAGVALARVARMPTHDDMTSFVP